MKYLNIIIFALITSIVFPACNGKTTAEAVNKSTSTDHYAITKRVLTPEQKEWLKTPQEKINSLSAVDKKRYADFVNEVAESKTGSELAKIIQKYKDLTKKIR